MFYLSCRQCLLLFTTQKGGRDFFGKEFFEYEVPEGTTAQELLKLIAESYPQSEQILNVTRVAHRDEYLSHDEVLIKDGSYALIPPVSGG